ncbi:MAG: fibro-slime domain-containing protein [Fibromonadales bacterium]|nr:fibro-slime domain-containing protein [Fibromonadales bacterium]
MREIGWLGSCELPSGGSSSSEGTSSSSSGEQSGSVCLTDGQESFCEYDTGCFSIYSPYNSSCDQLINACVQNGSLYTGVSGLNASNNYGTGLKCAQQGGTWAGLGKDPNAVVLGCCKWETSNSCYEVYDPQEANDCNSGGNLFWAGEACSATASNHCPDGGSSSSSTNAISLTELLNNAEIITLPFMKSGELVHLVKGESGIFREDFENYYAVAYKITLNQEDFININSSRNNDGDSYLYVYTKNGNEYAVFTEDDDGGGNLNSRIEREFEVGDYYIVVTDYDSNSHGSYTLNVGVAVAVVTDSLPNGMVGVVYGVPLASTAPALWSVVSDTLPPGLFMMSDTVSSFNYIGGTPTQAGTYVFTVKAENVSGSDTKTFTIMITEGSICEAEGEVWENGECVTPSNFVPITHITNVTQLETAALNGVSVGGRVEIGPMGEWMLGPFNATNRQNSINWTVIGPATIGLPQWLDSSFRVITFTGSGTVIITATVNDGLCNTPSPMTGYDPKCIFTQDWIINIYEGTPPPTYAQVTIGTQTWMKYNLNIETPGSVCYENNASNCEMYGRLYNGNTALTVCPSGWHLPSRTEWEVLTNYAGFEAGRKLKATSGWSQYPGTDNFGFAALPGGYGNNQPSWFNGIVGSDIEIGSWWTDTEFEDKIYSIFVSVPIESGNDYAFELDDKEQSLLSVRCIKNEVVLSPEEQCLITGGTWNDTLCSYFFPIQTITFYQPPSLPSATMVGNTIGYSTGSNLQIQPANATNRYIAWEATGGATIDTLNKKITFNQAGNVTITANIYGGKCQELANPECIFPVGTWTVEVYEPMSGFNLAAVIYDTDPSVNSSFREWGSSVQQTGIAKGIPQQTLLNGKMQFKQGKDGWTEQNFIDAFKPTPGKNVVRSYDMPFAQVKPGWWEFNSNKLCNDGTLDIYGDCSDNDRYVGGFFPPELQTRADADYSQCPNCDKKYTATSWVPLNNTISQFCYDRGRSGTGTTLAECGLEFAEGAFVDGTNPAIWDWGMQYNMSNATKNTFYCFENAPVEFTYKKGQEFFISGQDDIWIYINNKLVIDLGGTHMAAPGYVNLNTLELNEGESYPLNIFFCDRQTSMSNIRIATNINLTGVIPVTGIQISIPDTVNVGDAIPYRNVRVVPENATDKAISWSVSSGVQMDSTVFRFNGEGIATITATVGGYTQTWKVHVMPVFVPVDSIMVTPGLPIEIAYDGTLTLPAVSILPTNATNRAITWVASGATVIENNKVVFDQNVNMATISAVVKGGLANGDFIKTWRIIVNLPPTVEAAPEFIAVSNIRVNIPDTATIENIIQLNAARILPRNSNAAEKNTEIEWHIPGAEIADGIASLANIGKVILTATIPNGLSEGQDYTQSWSIIVVAPPEPEEEEPAVIAVDSIKAFFPKFVTRGDMIYLGLEHAMPINATYRDIKWSFNDEEIYDVNVPIEFLQVGVSEITATILDDMEEEHFTQTWRIAVSAPVTYAVTVIDNESLERSTKRYEVDQRVTIIANSTQRTEFARWRITSKNKIVALDSVELYSPILSFLMPKMDLEIEPIYEHKYAVIINGVNEKLLYTGELVEVTNEPLKAGYKFSYWNVFPIGMIPEEDRKNSTLSFEMPATDIMLRAVLSEEVEARRGEIIDVADIVKESNVGEWLTTSTGKDIIEAVRDENSGAITITANVESEEVVAVETDVPPNATELDSIRIVYTATGSWRLYLDIIGLPYSEGYYVELESLAQPKQDEQEEVRPAPPAVRSFSYSMPSIMSAPEETNVGGITKTFPLSAFKNTLGESIDNNLVRMVSSMSFAPEESGSSTLTITSLASEMKPLDSEVKKACLAEIGMAWDKYAGNDGACKPVAQVNCEGYAENPNGNSWLEGVCKTPIRIICENDPTKEWRGGTCKLKDVYDQDECIDEGYYWTADGKCRTKTELDRDDCTNAGNYWGNDGICRSPVQISCEGANKIWSKGQCKTREEDACERDLGVWKEDGEVCEYSLFVSGRPNVSPNIHITTSGKSIVFANLPTNAEISVYGVRGNVIYAGATGSAAGGTQRIDNVASGAYIIRIRAPGVNYSKVVSIQK